MAEEGSNNGCYSKTREFKTYSFPVNIAGTSRVVNVVDTMALEGALEKFSSRDIYTLIKAELIKKQNVCKQIDAILLFENPKSIEIEFI